AAQEARAVQEGRGMTRYSLIALGLILIGGTARPASAMHDSFRVCVAPDGTEYDVELPEGKCRDGDQATRCLIPTGSGRVVYTRGPKECQRRGGHPFAIRITPDPAINSN